MHQNCFLAGALTQTPLGELMMPPIPIVGWGGGRPIPILLPSTPSASRSGPACYSAPNTNSCYGYGTRLFYTLRTPYQNILATPLDLVQREHPQN